MLNNTRALTAIIVGLLIIIAILGYMLMQERQKSVSINLPGVKIEAQ
jgi:uncharacterized integral membrane protein